MELSRQYLWRTVKRNGKLAVQKFLERLVKLKLRRTQAVVIGITGSFGKTSTKEAVYEVLKTKWKVYRNPKSLNTEIGLLLAVLEQPSGFSSPLKWTAILGKAVHNALFGKKYDFLILEYGADKPDDIEHLISLVKPHVGIITNIGCAHQADGQFKDEEAVFNEKKKLVTHMDSSGIAIINAADNWLKKLKGTLHAKTFWFNAPDIFADKLNNTTTGFSATIHVPHKKVPANFSIIGTIHINVILPALLCGLLHGISLEEGIEALENFKLPPGRMSIIEGKNGAVLLDSTYNASPRTVAEALNTLRDFPCKRKIAVIGNMNELGDNAASAHKEVLQHIGPWLYMLVTVGDLASLLVNEALKKGLPATRIKTFLRSEEAAEFLSPLLAQGDTVLLKGSQNKIRLERAVKLLMRHPQDAKNLLCRQESEWEKIE